MNKYKTNNKISTGQQIFKKEKKNTKNLQHFFKSTCWLCVLKI